MGVSTFTGGKPPSKIVNSTQLRSSSRVEILGMIGYILAEPVHGWVSLKVKVCVKQKILLLGSLPVAFLYLGCASAPPPSPSVAPLNCSSYSTTSLKHYDEMAKEVLDDHTMHPSDNNGGSVVWNTRYYLESLLAAYNATANPKYIKAFLDTGTWVMNMTQTLAFLDQDDPSAPGKTASGPLRSATGWPTYMATFGVPVAIPTPTGQIALYAQSLYASGATGAGQLKVSQKSDGSLELDWWRSGQALQSFSARNVDDLKTIAATPLVYAQSPGRLTPTGLGLPAPGLYALDNPLLTIWHGEQTGGILIPFLEFLLIAKDHQGLVDAQTASAWQSKILSIAADYEDHFVPDGSGGLLIRNPEWMPSTEAGLLAPADYVYAEALTRLLLYKLSGEPKELSLAKGLVLHQVGFHWQINPQGWLLLKIWPCIHPWSSRSEAASGSIWDSLTYDPATPEISTAGGLLSDLMHFAKKYNLSSDLGFSDALYTAHRKTFQEYLRTPFGIPTTVRNDYPTFDSTPSDPVDQSDDPFAGAGFLQPEVRDDSFIVDNWNWMSANGKNTQDWPIGYFLRAWARTEAAALQACQAH